MVESYQLFIDGAWRPSSTGETLPAINPFNQDVWAQVPQASEADVADAVAAPRHAYETTWRQTTGLQRATLMHRLADLLETDAQRMGLLETTDNGKVIRETAPRMVHAMRTGVVWVNTCRVVAAQAPFGGVKDSGFGRERGEHGILEFTTAKNVMIDFSDEARDPFAIKT